MIEYAMFSSVSKLQTSLDLIRKKHPLVEEVAKRDMNDEVEELLFEVDLLQEHELENFALKIQNSKVELIFHALTQQLGTALKEKLIFILTLRLKKRFFNYNWIMLQEHYDKPFLIESFHLLTDFIKDKYPEEFHSSLASRITFSDEDLVKQALSVLRSEPCTLKVFMERYNLIKESALSNAILGKYFVTCDKVGFQENTESFIDWIRTSKSKSLPQIVHYLNIFNVLEYIEEINYFLIESFELPKNSPFWEEVSGELQVKFLQWNKINILRKHLDIKTEKFLFWKNYYHLIDQIDYYQDLGMMFMYIPGHIVVDFKKYNNKSYLYKKRAFKNAYRDFDAGGGFSGKYNWPLELEKVVPLKDNILENKYSDVYELSYERLGKLYIRDYLETIL